MSQKLRNTSFTLLLLSLGYFIDFYDLTIMGVSYSELIKEQFNIIDATQIQQTYLLISNFQTAGIFIGAVIFGILGDKIGRAAAIRYSILLYSIATIASVYTHSLPVFIALRMLAYIGLATEFSTSTVLILELLPIKSAAWGTAILYSFGVLGGITATSIGFISWKAMFLCGGVGGLVLYIGRSHIQESANYLNAKLQQTTQPLGSIFELFKTLTNLKNIAIYFVMITPYFAMITMMFIFPNYMIKNFTLGYATKMLLIGFFVGNIISSLLSGFFFNHKRIFMLATLLIFITLMNIYRFVPEEAILAFSIGLGLIGGGYPIIWAQMVANAFPIHIRSLASNVLFALGRASSIGFNIIISTWIVAPSNFIHYGVILTSTIFIMALGCVLYQFKK